MTDGTDWKNLFKQQVRENIQLEQAVEYLQGLLQSIVWCTGAENPPGVLAITLEKSDMEDFEGGILKVDQGEDALTITLTPQGS